MLINRMSEDLGVPISFIDKLSRSAPYYYKWYKIPKKNGGFRDIYQPSPVFKTFQYWMIQNIFAIMPVTSYSTAYSKGASVVKNATPHLNKRFLVHFDIKDFFPSITEYHVINVLLANQDGVCEKIGFKLEKPDIDLVCRFVLYNGRLTIGSPSSPCISNSIMYNADVALANLADTHTYTYTRYADDMVFSSNDYIPAEIEEDIELILKQYRLKLNKEKTYFMGPRDRKVVTGVNINNERLTIGRKKRDEIKKMVYMKLKHNEGDSNKILGHLNYLKSVDLVYYERIIQKYPGILNALKNDCR